MERNKENPLSSYRALDLTDDKGCFCGKVLADIGMDVIKVEKPDGDPARNNGPFYHGIPDSGKSLHWFALNAGKRGVTLDIESETGRKIFLQLVASSDFVIESFAPDYMDGLGLGYREFARINPRIILTSIRQFADSGPYRDFVGTDFTAMASSGLIFSTGDRDRPPVAPCVPQAYFHAGVQAAAATMIGHYHRLRTGCGQQVITSVQASVSCFNPFSRYLWEFNQEIAHRSNKIRVGSGNYFRVIWPCKDGYVAFRIFTGGSTHSRRVYPLVKCMQDEGIAEDLVGVKWEQVDVMQDIQAKLEHWEDAVGRFFMRHTKAELFDLARRYGFMFLLPVNTMEDVVKDPHLAASKFFVNLDYPEIGAKIAHPGAFYKSTAISVGPRRRAPMVGEHNLEVFGELGYARDQLISLKSAKVI